MAGANQGESGHPRVTADDPGSSQSGSEAQKGMKETGKELASKVGDAASQIKDKAQEFASGVASQAHEAWQSTREGVSTVAHKAEDFWGDVTDLIRRYPVASVAVAFGLGCLMSSALFRSFGTDDMARRMSRQQLGQL